MDLALLDSRLVIALVSTGLGAFLMFLIQMIGEVDPEIRTGC